MKTLISLAFVLALVSCRSGSPQPTGTATVAPSSAEVPHKGAVIAGDFPDPSVIKVGDTYWATATSSAWVPAYPIFTSKDLANWKIVGAVYQKPPAWTAGNYWAPEIAKLGDTYYVYFSAKHAKHGRMCLGVGTAKDPAGPYRDHGPLICEGPGSIDAMPVVDDNGDKYLFWKEDGNSQQKPTPIHLQKLDATGTKLVGKKMDVLVNDAPWEAHLVEGPFVMKRGDTWYMFYSGNACCGLQCNYALGVARAKTLTGPWEKNPNNPILKGNAVWKCPGHGSIVQDEKNRDVLLYHAYHSRDSVYVGRQAMADVVEWGEDGWPTINKGAGPGIHADGFLDARLRNEEHRFQERFEGPTLSPAWQWPRSMSPRVEFKDGELALKGEGKKDPFATVIGRATTLGDYVASVDVVKSSLEPGVMAGLAAYGESGNALGVYVVDDVAVVVSRTSGRDMELARLPLPKNTWTVTLRMEARGGSNFRFSLLTNADPKWQALGGEVSGEKLPPWDLGIRVALTASGGEARFAKFSIEPLR